MKTIQFILSIVSIQYTQTGRQMMCIRIWCGIIFLLSNIVSGVVFVVLVVFYKTDVFLP